MLSQLSYSPKIEVSIYQDSLWQSSKKGFHFGILAKLSV